MTGGGSFGEGARDDEAESRSPGGRGFEEPTRRAAWEPPGWDYPPPHPGAYHPGYEPGSAAPYPPPMPPPANVPAYQQPPDRPYPPVPPPPGHGPPPGYEPAPYFGGYPPPAYPGGYGPPGARPGTNGFAVASLVSSLTGLLCCIGSIAGIVLGIVALSQVKQTRQGGHGMAVAGIVIGGIGVLIGLVVTVVSISSR